SGAHFPSEEAFNDFIQVQAVANGIFGIPAVLLQRFVSWLRGAVQAVMLLDAQVHISVSHFIALEVGPLKKTDSWPTPIQLPVWQCNSADMASTAVSEWVGEWLLPDQLVLLLECLLEKKTLCSKMLECLQKTYHLREQDAERQGTVSTGVDKIFPPDLTSLKSKGLAFVELAVVFFFFDLFLFLKVRHRWCELVIKHKYTAGYRDIENFLKEDQAMGVYLYGELMVNEDAKQQALARRSFATIRDQMDVSSAKVVAEMLF
ncbi:hypothetical protein lerEdw1_000169, partial [Lerista edwardsae]